MPQGIESQITRHQIQLQRLAGGNVKKILPVLKKMVKEIQADLLRKMPDDADAMDPNLIKQLQVADAQTRAIIKSATSGITDILEPEFNDLLLYETQVMNTIYSEAVTVELSGVTAEAMKAAVSNKRMKLFSTTGKHETATIKMAVKSFEEAIGRDVKDGVEKTLQLIRGGFISGETNPAIARKIASNIDPVVRRQANALVRTATNHIGSIARQEFYEANERVLKGEKFLATLDSRTSLVCFPIGTKVMPIGKLERMYKRLYTGEFVTIRTATGNEIMGTPNHPVLTSDGWLPLNKIEPGKHVVYSISDKSVGVFGDDSVTMPTDIGKLFDSFSNKPIVDVYFSGSSTDQFHGDGMGIDEKVHVATSKTFLGSDVSNSGRIKHGGERHFSVRHYMINFFGLRLFDKLLWAWRPFSKAINWFYSCFFKSAKKPRFASILRKFWRNIPWMNAFLVKFNDHSSISDNSVVNDSPWEGWHHTKLLEEICNRGSGSVELPAYGSGTLTVPVFADNIVSMDREFKSCHVYNLQCLTGLYHANGFIVKNCAGNDGKIFDVGTGPVPPLHWNCRSVRVAEVKDVFKIPGLAETRSSIEGPISDKVTYGGFLKRQSKEFQNDVLGKKRADLFRSGKISIDKFTDNGRVLTLDELKRIE